MNIMLGVSSTIINCNDDYVVPHYYVRLLFLFRLLSCLNFVWFSILGGSEAEQAEGSDVIVTKQKKSNKKPKSVSRGKKLKKEKSLRYKKESDEEKRESDQEKQDHGERLAEENIPQGDQNDDAESSSKETDGNESRGALRENGNEEESGSGGNENDSDGEKSSPREVEKSPKESASPDGAKIAEVSDDELLVNCSSFAELWHLLLFTW